MPVRYGKNDIAVGHASNHERITRKEGELSAASMPGTVGHFDENLRFVPSNTGDLAVLDRDFLSGKTAQDAIPGGQYICAIPCKPKLFLNVLMDKGLDVKYGYAMYINEAGLATNVAPADGGKIFGYAEESVVTSDAPKLIVIHIA